MKKGYFSFVLIISLLMNTSNVYGETRLSTSTSKPFGVFLDYYMSSGRITLDHAIDLGNQKARVILPWHLVEPTAVSGFDFSLTDQGIGMHHAASIDMVVTLLSRSSWATRGGSKGNAEGSSPPKEMARYENFIRKVVGRYKDEVKYWQIENEIYDNTLGSSKFWEGTKEEYVELLKRAYTIIKQVDPEAKVVLQGFPNLLFVFIEKGNQNALLFFDYIMRETKDYSDVIDFHQYFEYDSSRSSVKLLKYAMRKHGYRKDIISTEAGDFDIRLIAKQLKFPQQTIAIAKKLLAIPEVFQRIKITAREGVSHQEFIDLAIFLSVHPISKPLIEKYQSENLVKRISVTLALGVKHIDWVGIRAFDKKHTPDWYFTIMPLMDKNSRRKPHYYTYKLLIEKMNGFIRAQEIKTDPQIIKYQLENKDVFVLWNDAEKVKVNMSQYIKTPNALVTQIITKQGQREAKTKIVPITSIEVSETPVFVERLD